MKTIRELLFFFAFAALFVARIFVDFSWISSLALASLALAIFDILSHAWNDNPRERIKRPKLYLFFLLLVVLIEIVLIVLATFNVVQSISWLNTPLFTDLLTIFVLFLGVFQPTIISFINSHIQKQK